MSSNAATVGNRAGKPVYTFTDVDQDTGPIGFGEVPGHYAKRGFQLIGTGTGLAVQLYGTYDLDTAEGNASNWFVLPAEATQSNAAWANPLTTDPTASAYYVSAPLVAMRAVSQATTDGHSVAGSVSLIIFAAP